MKVTVQSGKLTVFLLTLYRKSLPNIELYLIGRCPPQKSHAKTAEESIKDDPTRRTISTTSNNNMLFYGELLR